MSTPLDITQQFFGSVGARDLPAIVALFADHIEWFVPGNFPWSGRRTEKAQVRDFFETMWPYTVAGKNEVLNSKMIASGNDVALFATFRQTLVSTGQTFTVAVAAHLTIEDGKIVALNMVEDTMAVSAAFGFN
ncbi:nuclear transport factor 2 family protein [Janthinobacterium agaricidamnosum]|nr:nuclear transport factor 2 family protein [Janthinobacterium agaricidamnosum]